VAEGPERGEVAVKLVERWPLTILYLLLLGVTAVLGSVFAAILWKLGPWWTGGGLVVSMFCAFVEIDRRAQRRGGRR